jgi:hypothetical protein
LSQPFLEKKKKKKIPNLCFQAFMSDDQRSYYL